MSTPRNDWTAIMDVNERRKAQNRVAQRNYRMRQKMRIEIAEAILLDLPHVRDRVAKKRRQLWPAITNEGEDGGSRCLPEGTPSFTGSLDEEPSAARILATDLDGSHNEDDGARGDGVSNNIPFTLSQSPGEHMDTSNDDMGLDFEISPDVRFSAPFHTSNADPEYVDSALTHTNWSYGEPLSPPPSGSLLLASGPKTTATTTGVSTPDASKGDSSGDFNFALPTPASSSFRASDQSYSSPALTPSPVPPLSPSSGLVTNSNTESRSTSVSAASNISNFIGQTPLTTAISRGNLDIARLLIKSGADLEMRDRDGRTALHRAVTTGHPTAVTTLLELGADVLATDGRGMGVLHIIVDNNQPEMARLVLDWLHNDCNHNLVESSSHCYSRLAQKSLNARDGRKMTPVHMCVELERLNILQILLQYGADVNIGCS